LKPRKKGGVRGEFHILIKKVDIFSNWEKKNEKERKNGKSKNCKKIAKALTRRGPTADLEERFGNYHHHLFSTRKNSTKENTKVSLRSQPAHPRRPGPAKNARSSDWGATFSSFAAALRPERLKEKGFTHRTNAGQKTERRAPRFPPS